MATSAISDVITALVAQAKAALPSIDVIDGEGITLAPESNMLLIGVTDPDASDDSIAATATQTWAHANHTARDEAGEILCAAVASNGDADQTTARTNAFATVAAVENMLRANPSLGLPTLLWTSFGTRIRLSQNQSDQGAIAIVYFQVEYRARI